MAVTPSAATVIFAGNVTGLLHSVELEIACDRVCRALLSARLDRRRDERRRREFLNVEEVRAAKVRVELLGVGLEAPDVDHDGGFTALRFCPSRARSNRRYDRMIRCVFPVTFAPRAADRGMRLHQWEARLAAAPGASNRQEQAGATGALEDDAAATAVTAAEAAFVAGALALETVALGLSDASSQPSKGRAIRGRRRRLRVEITARHSVDRAPDLHVKTPHLDAPPQRGRVEHGPTGHRRELSLRRDSLGSRRPSRGFR